MGAETIGGNRDKRRESRQQKGSTTGQGIDTAETLELGNAPRRDYRHSFQDDKEDKKEENYVLRKTRSQDIRI
eukprot:6071529-Karenia_brevis.AAC.1